MESVVFGDDGTSGSGRRLVPTAEFGIVLSMRVPGELDPEGQRMDALASRADSSSVPRRIGEVGVHLWARGLESFFALRTPGAR